MNASHWLERVVGKVIRSSHVRDPREACVTCHFFTKTFRDHDGRPLVFGVKQSERDASASGDWSWHAQHYAIGCYCEVWNEGYDFDHSSRHELVVTADRSTCPDYWPHHEGTFLTAGQRLRDLEVVERKGRFDRRLAIVGLWIAAIALLVDVIMRAVSRS